MPIPKVTEVPYYTSNIDDALDLKGHILGFIGGRRLHIEEVKDEDYGPRWRAKVIDGSNQIVAEGEAYDCAAPMVVAILSDFIANDGASWWIDIIDEGFAS